MDFTIKDRHLIKCLRVSKGYGATRLRKMSPDRQWNVDGVKTLIKKPDMTGSIDCGGMVVHAVRIRLPTSTKASHSAKKINHRHTVHNGKLCDEKSYLKSAKLSVVCLLALILNIPWVFFFWTQCSSSSSSISRSSFFVIVRDEFVVCRHCWIWPRDWVRSSRVVWHAPTLSGCGVTDTAALTTAKTTNQKSTPLQSPPPS